MFEQLWASAQKEELILIDGGILRFHLRQDGQLTIYDIVVLPHRQGEGIGRQMLEQVKARPGATSIFAKVPDDLDAGGWYRHMGFVCEGFEMSQSKNPRKLNLWRLNLR